MSYYKESEKRLLEAIVMGNADCFFLSQEDSLWSYVAKPYLPSSKRKKGALVIIDEGEGSRFNAGDRLMTRVKR